MWVNCEWTDTANHLVTNTADAWLFTYCLDSILGHGLALKTDLTAPDSCAIVEQDSGTLIWCADEAPTVIMTPGVWFWPCVTVITYVILISPWLWGRYSSFPTSRKADRPFFFFYFFFFFGDSSCSLYGYFFFFSATAAVRCTARLYYYYCYYYYYYYYYYYFKLSEAAQHFQSLYITTISWTWKVQYHTIQ